MRRFMVAASVLGAALAAAATPAPAEPALWAVKDGRSTIYLFGTVHVVMGSTRWESRKIAAAFAASEDLFLELIENDAQINAVIAERGVDPERRLSARLSPGQLQWVHATALRAGLPPENVAKLDAMRPWAAGRMLSHAMLMQAGYDPKTGVDRVLNARASRLGKPIHGLETIEQQLRFATDLPESTQVKLLLASLDSVFVGGGAARLDFIVDIWLAGDVAGLEKRVIEPMKRRSPEAYRHVLIERNEAWADILAARLKQSSGTSFVAVGAAHLAGPDSLQHLLEARGFHVERQ
jgi:uncharacterized protein YbaP (TraB family)